MRMAASTNVGNALSSSAEAGSSINRLTVGSSTPPWDLVSKIPMLNLNIRFEAASSRSMMASPVVVVPEVA